MKTKICKILGLLIILSTITMLTYKYRVYLKDVEFQNKTISTTFSNSGNKINDAYLGYISIPKIKIKRLIKEGMTKEILDQNYVGHVQNSCDLNSQFGNVILAGHNTPLVFDKLKLLKTDDEINITTYQNNYKYKVRSKQEIDITKLPKFNSITGDKILTIITCTKNNDKRLIIIGKLLK